MSGCCLIEWWPPLKRSDGLCSNENSNVLSTRSFNMLQLTTASRYSKLLRKWLQKMDTIHTESGQRTQIWIVLDIEILLQNRLKNCYKTQTSKQRWFLNFYRIRFRRDWNFENFSRSKSWKLKGDFKGDLKGDFKGDSNSKETLLEKKGINSRLRKAVGHSSSSLTNSIWPIQFDTVIQ